MYCVSESWECASYLTQLSNDLSDNLKNSISDLIHAVAGVAVDNLRNGETGPVKRLRTRLLEEVGEHAEGKENKGRIKSY